MEKYKLTKESITYKGHILYRIRYKKGILNLLGGFIESEKNLSQRGKCLVLDDAKVYEDALISGNARVEEYAEVSEKAHVFGEARVSGKSQVFGSALIHGNALLYHNSRVGGYADVKDDVLLIDSAFIYGYALLTENCHVSGCGKVRGEAKIGGRGMITEFGSVGDRARVYGRARVKGRADVYGNARIYDRAILDNNVCVCGEARVYGNAILKYGYFDKDILEDTREYIACSLNVYPINGYYYLFKRVNKIEEGVYKSIYNNKFIYNDGRIAHAIDPDLDILVGCGSGLHVSTPKYWEQGNALIGVKVREDQVITCQEGKLRVKSLEVLGEIKNLE